MAKKIFLISMLVLISTLIGNAYAADSNSTIVGTLSAIMDSNNETVTAMFVGYCKGEPVIIGPSTWTISTEEFSKSTAEDIGNKLCGNNHTLKKVIKSTHTGKEIVAEVVISSTDAPILVGR